MVNKKKNIFISYRVRDTQAATGRLVDALKQHFDSDQIFMDIDKIEPGLDFTEVISKSLDNCDVLLAMIGPDWMAFDPEKQTYRIHNENDWVRLEIATALRRNIRVVPVLLEGASLPEEADLPEDLKPLLRRQSYEITNKRWQYDSGELIEFLQKLFGESPKRQSPPMTAVPPPKKSYRNYWLIGGAFFLLILLVQMCNPEEPKIDLHNNGGGGTVNPNVILPDDKHEEPIQQLNVQEQPANVAGNWQDPVGMGRFVFSQEAGKISMLSYGISGEQTGSGNGVIIGRIVSINALIYVQGNSIPAKMKFKLSENEQMLDGNVILEENGASYTEPMKLQRQ